MMAEWIRPSAFCIHHFYEGVGMSEKDAFADLRKAKEEGYFRKKEQELIEKMQRRAQLEAERQQMGETIGIADEEILQDLQELGYTRESVSLLHLVPLVQVAWAEDNVTQRERQLIYEVARLRGIEEGSPAHRQLTDWLNHKLPKEFFQNTLRVLGAILEALPMEKRQASKQDLVSYCTQVATVSGGILGLGRKISDEEQALLEQIAAELERNHEAATKEILEK